MGLHNAGLAAQLCGEVTLYTHGDQDSAAELMPLVEAATAKITVDSRQIKRLVDNGGSLTIEFANGSAQEEAFLVHNPQAGVKGPFVEQLGLAVAPEGHIEANIPGFQSNVRGVFAAGDVASPYKSVNVAIASGFAAAGAAIAQLQAEKYNIPEIF